MDVHRLFEHFSESLIAPDALLAAVEDVRKLTNARTAQFLTVGTNDKPKSVFMGDLDPSFSALEPDYWEINPRAQAADRMVVGKAVRDCDFVTPDEIKTSRAYQELLIPAGLANFSGIICNRTNEGFTALALFQGEPDDAFSDAAVRTLETVSRIVWSVERTRQYFDQSAARRSFSLHASNEPSALLNRKLSVIDWNPAFGELISRKKITIDRFGLSQVAGSDLSQQLSRIAAAQTTILAQKLVLRDRYHRILYIAELIPVPSVLRSEPGSEPFIILRLNPYTPPELDTALVRSAMDLTDAEIAVLSLLVLGHDVREVAEMRGTSVHTVRTQIRRILEKAHTSRQVDLVRIVVKHFTR